MEKQTKGVHLTGDGLSVSAVAYGQTLLLEGSSLGYQLVLFPKGNCFFVLHGFRINFRSSPSWTSMDELTDFSFWCGVLRFGLGGGKCRHLLRGACILSCMERGRPGQAPLRSCLLTSNLVYS